MNAMRSSSATRKTGIALLLFIASIGLFAQHSGVYRNEPWNGMQIKYSLVGAKVTESSEGGPFCCWIQTLKGELAASGELGVSGSVGMGAGFEALAAIPVSVDGKDKSWTATVKSGSPKMNWADFQVSIPIPPGASTGRVRVDMTGSYSAGTRGLTVEGTFTRSKSAPAPAPPAPAPPLPVPKPLPKPPAPAPVPKGKTVNEVAADLVDEYIRQFDDACFHKVVRLGDPAKFRKALTTEAEINVKGAALTKKRNAKGSTETFDGSRLNIIHLPFNPLKDPMGYDEKRTIIHEATHVISWMNNDHTDPLSKDFVGFRDRNTAYLDRIADTLKNWMDQEKGFRSGELTYEDHRKRWSDFERRMRSLEAGQGASEVDGAEGQWWKPDLRRLEAWTGIRARFDDIRNLYLSGACGPTLQRMASGLSAPASTADDGVSEYRDEEPARPAASRRTVLKKRVEPVYPIIAKAARIEGEVVIEVRGNAEGRVVMSRLVKSVPLLDEAALTAAAQCEFQPPVVDGKPVGFLYTLTFTFKLER